MDRQDVKKLLTIVFLLISSTSFGQTGKDNFQYYNGKLIPLNIDSFQTGYNTVDTLGFWIIYWYNIDGDTFGKFYDYYDNAFKTIQNKSLVKYRPPIVRSRSTMTNWEYFGRNTYFYQNGNKWSEQFIVNEQRNGKYAYYFNTGEIKYLGYYKDGKKVGDWLTYNKSGTVIKTKHY